jgi:hypothetical protein
LPSQSQSDPAWLPTAETSVFTGSSLEEAIEEARTHLGARAQIRAARRVKQGLRGRVRFEVLAAPAPADAVPQNKATAARERAAYHPAPIDTAGLDAVGAVDMTLDQLLAAADERETAAQFGTESAAMAHLDFEPTAAAQVGFVADAAPPAPDEDFTALVRAALQRIPLEAEAPAGDGPHPAPELLDAVAGLLPRQQGPVPDQRPLALELPAHEDLVEETDELEEVEDVEDPVDAEWSLQALVQAGVPSQILDRLPDLDPDDDLGWLTSLRDAIGELVPAPARLGEGASAVVDGVGAAGATQILRAGLAGFTPGTLKMNGKTLRATAAELALAVRSCVVC